MTIHTCKPATATQIRKTLGIDKQGKDIKMSYIKDLNKRGLITPPKHVVDGVQYEVLTGSVAYGVSSDASDMDIYGFSIPKKTMIFPHLAGKIEGFGKKTDQFAQYQQHHIKDKGHKKEYDITIFSIIKYFQLCMDNNPNMIDSLFVPRRCVLYTTQLGEMVRENRHMFLHKGSWHKFKGYAYSQLHKMEIKKPNPESKRYDSIIKHGYDVKFAYHVVRLIDEAEQILTEHTINLERNREQLKAIRRGDWRKEDVKSYFSRKEITLEQVYIDSKLQHSPDEILIKQLLLNCLEQHFGSLDKAIVIEENTNLINDLEDLVQKYRR